MGSVRKLIERLRKHLFARSNIDLPSFETRLMYLREILQANNHALGFITRIQMALAGEIDVTPGEVRKLITGCVIQTYKMVSSLQKMTGNKENILMKRFEDVKGVLSRRVDVGPALKDVGMVIPLSQVSSQMGELVGQKSAFLGEATGIIKGHVPDGFATTVFAYKRFMEEGDLNKKIENRLREIDSSDFSSYFRASAEIVQWIENAKVPDDLAEALLYSARNIHADRFAVRSSALMEGGEEMSFAGQYRSLLNVMPESVPDAFKMVVASKYTPQALIYRLSRGIDDAQVAMCCCILKMINAKSAGVAYSLVKVNETPMTLVQAVQGLGLSAVDGSVEPCSFFVSRESWKIVSKKKGLQNKVIRPSNLEGTEEVVTANEIGFAIEDEGAIDVAKMVHKLVEHMGDEIDVEWAFDQDGKLYILQVRPQPFHGDISFKAEIIPNKKILLEGGSRVSGGVGCGEVSIVFSDLDILRFKENSVLVVHEADPRYAVLLPKASAVIADMGEVTGHLAAVTREIRIPGIFATREATKRLRPGDLVTVDADACVVYEGRVEEAIQRFSNAQTSEKQCLRTLKAVSPLIVPLHLTGRLSSGYSAKKCKTLHDMIRYCHQMAIQHLFELGDSAHRAGVCLKRMRSRVPIDLRILDVGGGLVKECPEGEDITPDHIACLPLKALFRGMSDENLKWNVSRSVSLKGFMSSVVNFNFDPDVSVRKLGEQSYVFITSDWFNLNSRVGYHFSTIDAKVTDLKERNYVSFRFVGGSTGIEQRSRRALLIQRILNALGFETDRQYDLVNARLRYKDKEEMLSALHQLGLLMGFVNHLDMELVSDDVMIAYEEAFLRKDYGYKGARS